ncbi:MAG: mechanosensitive ion channel family protein [Sulfurimonas sp.]|nr:mechanosensitive ion channel family protein [Sulfurimonas sp.]
MMSEKNRYINTENMYEDKIFALNKIIKINKRAGNGFAVLRDEVQVKSYILLNNQNRMIRDILLSLDDSDNIKFKKDLNNVIIKNQTNNQLLMNVDYKLKLEIDVNSKTLDNAKKNIKEFYALIDINQDVINYLYLSENRIYRLNKYSKYNLISVVIFVKNTKIAAIIDPIIEPYGLDVVKLLIIIFLIFIIYIIRTFVLSLLETYIIKIEALAKYAKDILRVTRKPLELLIIIININMITYIYNDFISIDMLEKIFNIIYGLLFTFVMFKVLNTIANIKVQEIDTTDTKVKYEIINVGLKVLNFVVLLIGLLITLHFAGANLTAFLSGLGIGGFAVALAAKDSLANFFGTLSILFSDVFSQGDWIVVNGEEGVVIEIGIRVTTLRTFDNALIAIPNAMLANQDVKNWNKRTLGRRIKMSLGIKYNSSSTDIKNAVKEIREMLDKHPDIATENTEFNYKTKSRGKLVSIEDAHGVKKTLLVYLDKFSDSSINILVYCFTKSVGWEDWLRTKEDVMHKIMDIFEKNNLEFAFPSLSIYNENQN